MDSHSNDTVTKKVPSPFSVEDNYLENINENRMTVIERSQTPLFCDDGEGADLELRYVSSTPIPKDC